MWLQRIKLRNFRNHLDSEFLFGEEVNLLLGNNGQGKTNVLEAISYLCLTRSFYANGDMLVLRQGQDMFEVEGVIEQKGKEQHIQVVFGSMQNRKIYFINRRQIEPFLSVIGMFPIVICSPEHAPITTGSPSERRKFMNLIMAQHSQPYYRTLIEYQRMLKQRNKILFEGKQTGRNINSELIPWDEQLVKLGATITLRRQKFVEEFQTYLGSVYHKLIGDEEPHIEYQAFASLNEGMGEIEVQNLFDRELQNKRIEERRIGVTLVGPHRDELLFTIDRYNIRKFASQGQHKTFLVALKLAEFFYLKERCQETPIILLDDVFSTLDKHRARRLFEFIGSLGQTFLTSTHLNVDEKEFVSSEKCRKFFIHHGSIVEQGIAAVL